MFRDRFEKHILKTRPQCGGCYLKLVVSSDLTVFSMFVRYLCKIRVTILRISRVFVFYTFSTDCFQFVKKSQISGQRREAIRLKLEAFVCSTHKKKKKNLKENEELKSSFLSFHFKFFIFALSLKNQMKFCHS